MVANLEVIMQTSSSSDKSWRERIFDLTRIKTTDSDVERKGQLLAMYLALVGMMAVYMLADNTLYLLLHPSREYVIFVIQDVFSLFLFFGLWKLNQNGWVQTAAYISIALSILISAALTPPNYLEYLMVIFALPIGISSFVIRPSSSFLFAALTALAYALSCFVADYVPEYNLIAILSLFALAFMTWVISWRLDNTLRENSKLVTGLKKSNAEIRDAYDTTLESWSLALDLRDKETEGHTQRVTELTVKFARALGFSEAELVNIRRGALLHDIGKLGVPDKILHKPDKLTEEEWQVMKQHPRYAYGLLYPIAYIRGALDIPCNHHEKWDGSGYPQGLKGEEIPLAARIFAVVDVYDALLYDRPYRKAWEKDKVLEYIKAEAGKHFDPRVTEVFLKEMGA